MKKRRQLISGIWNAKVKHISDDYGDGSEYDNFINAARSANSLIAFKVAEENNPIIIAYLHDNCWVFWNHSSDAVGVNNINGVFELISSTRRDITMSLFNINNKNFMILISSDPESLELYI